MAQKGRGILLVYVDIDAQHVQDYQDKMLRRALRQ